MKKNRDGLTRKRRPGRQRAIRAAKTRRKRGTAVDRKLRESEERFRGIAERSVDGIVELDLEGRITYVSPSAKTVLGYEPQEMVGTHIGRYVSESDFPKIAATMSTLLNGMNVTGLQGEVLRKDGTGVPAEVNAQPVFRDGKVVGVQGIVRDITRQKQLEDELRRHVQELDSLHETLLEITGRRELPQLLNSIVERAARLLGAPSGALYLCNPKSREVRCVVAYNTMVNTVGVVLRYGEGAAGVIAETGKPLIIDDYRTWPGRAAVYEKDRPFGAVLSAPMIWQGRVTGVIHVLRYDTKRFAQKDLGLLTMFANHASIAVENARLYDELQSHANHLEDVVNERSGKLAESEARYRRLFEASPISLWEEDFSEVKKHFDELRNRGIKDFRRYFIEHPDDLAKCATMVKVLDVNETTIKLYGAKSVEELRGELRRVFTDEFRDRFREELVALAEGEARFASEFDNQTLNGDTKHVSLILNVIPGYEDTLAKVLVSIIDLTERKEIELRLHQAERLAAVGETAAMVGHDLRNPLQGVAGAVHLLKEGSLSPEERDEMLQVVEKSLEDCDATIRDLSEFAAEFQLSLTEATPQSIVRNALGAVKVPGMIAVRDLSEDHPTFRVDADKLRRVFINLIENAIDAMPEGGTLTISTKQSDGDAEIIFTDTGVGIPEKVMNNLWQPLQTTKAKGLGLGLAICKRIVDAHEGRISVKSKVGEGTTVTVRVPIKHDSEEVRQK